MKKSEWLIKSVINPWYTFGGVPGVYAVYSILDTISSRLHIT
nr:MAG TPA: hypothetical protein [Caudoviricetes sp.]